MRDLNQNDGTTFVFSTHDKRVMNRADRLVRMEDGQITALACGGTAPGNLFRIDASRKTILRSDRNH
jgi:ABC-type lipoprotein export system ATPase subunit